MLKQLVQTVDDEQVAQLVIPYEIGLQIVQVPVAYVYPVTHDMQVTADEQYKQGLIQGEQLLLSKKYPFSHIKQTVELEHFVQPVMKYEQSLQSWLLASI